MYYIYNMLKCLNVDDSLLLCKKDSQGVISNI